MPTSSASDSPRRSSSTDSRASAPLCPVCGARLSAGACPACALGLLLGGGSEPEVDEEEVALHQVEENVEFGRYTLKQRLAAGGMGVVYVAEDNKLKRTVALKMIRGSTFADDGEVARFTLEAEAAAALDHPNIVPIYEVGRMDGQPFFTMKLIEGTSLAQRMKDHGGTLPVREVARMLAQIARAVQHAHQRGVLHRDLKPGNILLDAEGQPWLTDFGLAKLTTSDTSLTLTRDHIGTPHYMAPEVAGGNARAVSTACDVWALGVMLWELLCGVPPFHGPGPVEIMRRIVESEPNWPAGSRADGDLVTIARRCMEKAPGRRPQSAGEVADELERWLRGEPIKARPVTRRERFFKWVRREPAMAALYAVLFVAMMTGLALWKRAENAVVSLKETNVRVEQSLRIATATKLAGDARLQVEENPSRALLLAVESAEMSERSGVLPESAAALTDVLQRTGGLDATAGGLRASYNEGWMFTAKSLQEAAQCSPDSRWLMTIDETGKAEQGVTAAVFDLHDHERSAPLRRWTILPPSPGEHIPLQTWCWQKDSRHIVLVDNRGGAQSMEAVSPAMLEGRAEAGPPQSVPFGSVAAGDLELIDARLNRGTPGENPAGVCIYRQVRTDKLFDCYYARWEISADGVHTWPVTRLTQPTRDYPIVDFLPGQRAVFRFFQETAPAHLIDFNRPGDAPVLLTVEDRAFTGQASPDGQRLLVREWDNRMWLFDLPAAGSAVKELAGRRLPGPGLRGSHEAFAFSGDGRWLAIGGTSDVVSLFDLKSGAPPVSLQNGGRSMALAFSADSRWLATGSNQRSVHLWNMEDVQNNTPPVVLRGCSTYITAVTFSPDGKNVVATGASWTVRRWPFDGLSGNAQPRHYRSGAGSVIDIAISPDREWIASACHGEAATGEKPADGSVTLSRVDGRSTTTLTSHARFACGVAFSRKGNWLVSTGHDNTVKVWDFPALTASIDSGRGPIEPKFILPVEARPMNRYSVTFHPGDGCLYQVNSDGVLYAWDLSYDDPNAHHQEEVIHSKAYLLPDVTVSPDGRWLAVARHAWDHAATDAVQRGNQVLLYDVGTFSWPPKFVTALKAGFVQETNLAFSADSRWLASGGDGTGASVWDLQATDIDASRRVSPTSAQFTRAVGFSPDGRWLATGGNDGRLHLWNWQLAEDHRMIETAFPINTLEWLDEGRIAAAGGGGRIMLWDTSVPTLKDMARRVAGRKLTDEERERFRIKRP